MSEPLSIDDYPDLAKVYELAGVSPSFKVGAYNIEADETLARLHQGEMVLTADNADQLRNLGSGGIDSLLQGLTAISSARVETPALEFSGLQSAMTSAIESQTESVVSVLNAILDAVLRIGSSRSSTGNSAVLSESLLDFSGV